MKNGSLILLDHYLSLMRIFLDTNILVKSYLVWNSNNKILAHSLIRDFGSVHDFIVSDFVFLELQNVLPRYISNFDETSIVELISYL
jgi:predicted nucleic acid-binding protein